MNILLYTPRAFSISETFIVNLLNLQSRDLKFIIAYNKLESFAGFSINNYNSKYIPSTPINIIDRIISKIIRSCNQLYLSLPFSSIRKVRKTIISNSIDAIYCQYGISAIPLFKTCLKSNLNLIIHFHGYDASSLLLDLKYRKSLEKLFSSKVNYKVIVVAEYMRQNLIEIGARPDKISLIPYGIDLKKIIKPTQRNSSKVKVLHAGRLTPKKGVKDLIKVISELPEPVLSNIKFDIIGDGEEYTECQKFIKSKDLNETIKMHGAQSHEIVLKFMSHADIFILNSRTSRTGDKEGFPNSIIEAMASGCAVLSTLHAGIPEAIDHEENGLLVNEYDNNQLKKELLRLIKDEPLRKRLSLNAIKKVQLKFSSEIQLSKIREVLISN